MKTYNMIISGQPVSANKTFDVINPASGDAFARAQEGDANHVNQADATPAARIAY